MTVITNDKIYPGQGIRVRGTFRDPATLALVDPGSVVLELLTPARVVVTGLVTKEDTGKYSGRYVVDQPGTWFWRMHGTSPGEAAKEGKFKVEESMFAE